jgi:hypothetical protein
MKTLIETLPDGTQNYLVDVEGLGMFFLIVFNGVPRCDHIETYPEHARKWCDVQGTYALN